MPQMRPTNFDDQQPEGVVDNSSESIPYVSNQTEGISSANQLLSVINEQKGGKMTDTREHGSMNLSSKDHGSSAFAIPENPSDAQPEVPTFAMIAEYIKKHVPWHIKTGKGQDNAVELIHATASVLLRADVEKWKLLSSDAPDSCSESGDSVISTTSASRRKVSVSAGNKVSFHIIGVEFRKLLTEKGIPDNLQPRVDRFRNGNGSVPKYFKKVLKPEKNPQTLVTIKDMDRFSILYSGLISKLYFSKVGYSATYDQLCEDVGSYVAEQALKAASVCPLFKYKLVVPNELYLKYNLCHAISDTFPIDQLMRFHTLRQGSTSLDILTPENVERSMNKTAASRPLPHLAVNVFESEGYSIPRRIEEKLSAIGIYEDDNNVAMQTIVENTKKIEQLKQEIESLNFLQEQQINAENLVSGIRSALKNDEVAFKEISEVVVEMVPELAKNLSKLSKQELTSAVLEAIKSVGNACSTLTFYGEGPDKEPQRNEKIKENGSKTTSSKTNLMSGSQTLATSQGTSVASVAARSKRFTFKPTKDDKEKEIRVEDIELGDNSGTDSSAEEEGATSENESILSTTSNQTGPGDSFSADESAEPAAKKARNVDAIQSRTNEIANVDNRNDGNNGPTTGSQHTKVDLDFLGKAKRILNP